MTTLTKPIPLLGAFDSETGNFLGLTPEGATGAPLVPFDAAAMMKVAKGVPSKLRAAMAAAAVMNPQSRTPWCAAPTWAINQTYGGAQLVRGTGADAANLYLMVGNNAVAGSEGVSAGSGTGPSGTGVGLITDNTCRWLYAGPATTADATFPLKATTDPVDANSVMDGYLRIITTTLAGTIGLTGYRPSTSSTFAAEAYFTGGIYEGRNQGRVNGPNGGTAAVPDYQSALERGSLKISTNSRKWIALRPQAVVYKNIPYEFLVNGRRLSETPYVLGADGAAASVVLINLAKFPEGEKTIEIRVYDNIQVRIAFEVWTEAESTVWPSANPNRGRLALEGDSLGAGAYLSGYKSNYWIERLVGDRLGIDAVYNNAIGGTGRINDLGGTRTTALQRGADLDAFLPDIILDLGVHNDTGNDSTYNTGTRTTTTRAWLAARRAANPNALIVGIGCLPLQGDAITAAGGASSLYQTEVDVKAAYAAHAATDPNVLFIPLMTDVRNKFGSGTTITNGRHFLLTTAPYNDSHALPFFYTWLAAFLAEKIYQWVLSKN